MKTEKIKRYRLGVSKTFPNTHPRKGEETFFVEKIQNNANLSCMSEITRMFSTTEFGVKIHTIRSNYPLWEKRMKEVQAGRAVIELFYWEDKPYRSKQVVFATLDKDSGCGVSKIQFAQNHVKDGCYHGIVSNDGITTVVNEETLAQNDGLSIEDFKAWFKGYDMSEPMAIIHFTKFRY